MPSFDIASLRFDAHGLIPRSLSEAGEGADAVRMNQASLEQTLATGRVTYWSRRRAF